MRIVVVDDQKIFREMVIENCHKYFYGTDFIPEIIEYDNGEELLQNQGNNDIIFLDIEMPKMDGLEAAKKLRERNCDSNIIFLTNYVEHMQKAFHVKAFRFLIKPIKYSEFDEALSQIMKDILRYKRLRVDYLGNHEYIRVGDIRYLESMGDLSFIHLKDSYVISNKTLKFWNDNLNFGTFEKIHKSYIVNLKYVSSTHNNEVVMDNGSTISISRRRKAHVNRQLKLIIG